MPFNSGSIITSRDNLALDLDRKALLEKIVRFSRSPKGDRSIEQDIGYSSKAKWDVEACKASIRNDPDRDKRARRVLYRPFDYRWIYYSTRLLDTPSKPVCDSVFGHQNLVLLTPKIKTSENFNHVLVSRLPAEKKSCSHDRATQMFPLYRYESDLIHGKQPNIGRTFGSAARVVGDSAATSEACLDYVYAVLHSPEYRRRFGNALRDSFPRIPLTTSSELFRTLAVVGGELIALHLLESPRLDQPITEFIGGRNPEVEKISWSGDTVWLDKTHATGFRGVCESVWNFHIGGYQVCEKWLKDRKGRKLSKDDIAHYHKIVVALSETIRLMAEIDKTIEKHGGWPSAFQVGEKERLASTVAAFRPRTINPKKKDQYVTCIPLVPLKAAAGAFSDPQRIGGSEFEWIEFKSRHSFRPGMFVAQVVGRSMEPLITDGSWCLFRAPVEGTRQGRIVLVELRDTTDPESGERYTVKRYESEKAEQGDLWEHTRVTLRACNPDYKPIVLTGGEGSLQVVAEFLEVIQLEAK